MLGLAAVAATLFVAQPGKSEFDVYVFAAAELFDKLEFERAYEQVQKAKAKSRGVADDALVALWEGILKAELQGPAESEAAFRTALLLDPNAALPVKVAPSVRERFEKVKADAQKAYAKSTPAPKEGVTAPPPEPAPDRRPLAAVPGVLCIAAAVTGAVLFVMAGGQASKLTNPARRFSNADAEAIAASGRLYETIGVVAFAVAGAAALTALGFALFGGPARVSAAATPSSGAVLLTWVLE